MRRHYLQSPRLICVFSFLVFFCLIFAGSANLHAQGIMFRGAGAVNQSMGGAGVACPLSATGALYWNPATMSAFSGTTVDVDLGIALADSSISSTVNTPYGPIGGTETGSSTGAIPVPNVAIIRKNECSPIGFGFNFGAVGGAKTNYASAAWNENPILSSGMTPLGQELGYGTLNSSVQLLQIGANMSYAVNEKLSFSFGPTITMGEVACDPLYLVEGHSHPSEAIHSPGGRYVWGAGFQVGAYYDTQAGWAFGASYKSQNWIEPIRFQTTEGEKRLKLDLPAILSFGMSYYGWDKWVFAWDFRYYFHENAGYDQVGWSDMFAFSMGVQRQMTDRLTLRVGYSMNENQLDSAFSRACIAVPLIPQHALFFGGSFKFDERMTLHLTYGHVFRATSTGPFDGQNPESGNVTIGAEADEITAGISFNF